jgi:sulfate adenylyltransferase subunit 1
LAIILIDARKGVLTQTRRHSYLAHLVGIPHIVVAVNKMDLVNYDQAFTTKFVLITLAFAEEIGLAASARYSFYSNVCTEWRYVGGPFRQYALVHR